MQLLEEFRAENRANTKNQKNDKGVFLRVASRYKCTGSASNAKDTELKKEKTYLRS